LFVSATFVTNKETLLKQHYRLGSHFCLTFSGLVLQRRRLLKANEFRRLMTDNIGAGKRVCAAIQATVSIHCAGARWLPVATNHLLMIVVQADIWSRLVHPITRCPAAAVAPVIGGNLGIFRPGNRSPLATNVVVVVDRFSIP